MYFGCWRKYQWSPSKNVAVTDVFADDGLSKDRERIPALSEELKIINVYQKTLPGQ